MALCLPEVDKDITKREIAMTKLAKTVLDEKGPEADFIRFALGVTYRQAGLGKGAMEGAFRLWVLDLVGVDLFPQEGNKLPTHEDIALLDSIIFDSKAKFREAKKYSDKLIHKYGSIEKAVTAIENGDHRIFTKFRRALPFTKRVNYYEKLIGGQVIYDKTLEIKGMHNAMRESFLKEIKDVLQSFDTLIGKGAEKEIKKLSELSADIAKLEQRQGILEEMESNGDLTPKFNKELHKNNAKLEELKGERDSKRYDHNLNPATAILSKAMEIIEQTNPKYREGIIGKTAKQMAIKPEALKDTIEKVENYFLKFTEIGENTIRNARSLVDMHLERQGFSEAEREKITEVLTFDPIEKGYFTRISVITKDAVFMQSIVNTLSEREFVKNESMEGHITRLVSDFMKHRESEVPTGERNFNLMDVMIKYTEQMLHTNYTTQISEALESHTMALRDIARRGGNDALDVYLEGYRREVEALRADAIGTTDHGIASNLSRASLAMQVAARLGLLNFGGEVRNYVEGTLMTASVTGYKMITNARNRRNDAKTKKKLEGYSEGQQINLSVEQFWHPEKGFAADAETLVEMIGIDLARHVTGARLENENWIKTASAEIQKGTSEMAKRLLNIGWIGWSAVENKTRSNAHKIGQVTGLTIAEETYRPLFTHGRVSEAIIKRFNLNRENALSADKDVRLKEYVNLEKAMVNRMGFEIMAATQWIYDAQERHYIEGWTPGGFQAGKHIALFQHYPLSWNTAMYLAMRRTFGRVRAGGFKAGLGGTTKESRWAMFGKKKGFNRDAVYLSSMAFFISAAMMFEKDWALTRKLGFRIYGLFSNPAIDVLEGLGRVAVGTATGNKELRDRAMFGKGVLNQVTGPPISDFMNVANLAAVQYGINSEEDWPDWLQALSRHTIGYTPNPEDANWDTQNKVDSVVKLLKRTTPFTSKGLPVIEHVTQDVQGQRSPFVTDLMRYILNITPVYNRKPAQDDSPEEAERVRQERLKDQRSEKDYGQETRRQ